MGIDLSLSYALFQIHWPVSPQRKTECVLSGKDTNVSAVFASTPLTYSDPEGRKKTENSIPENRLANYIRELDVNVI